MGVSTGPGETAFTRMPRSASSTAQTFVMVMTAPLDAP